MIKFLIRKDIDDSTLIDRDDISKIGLEQQQKFINKANKFYFEEAIELGVSEDDIMVYDPNIDTEDLRNGKCVKLAEYHFLKDAFFSLMKKDGDVFHVKFQMAEKEFNKSLSSLTPERIRGKQPSTRKSTNGYSVGTRYLGNASGSTCNSQNFDCECY